MGQCSQTPLNLSSGFGGVGGTVCVESEVGIGLTVAGGSGLMSGRKGLEGELELLGGSFSSSESCGAVSRYSVKDDCLEVSGGATTRGSFPLDVPLDFPCDSPIEWVECDLSTCSVARDGPENCSGSRDR